MTEEQAMALGLRWLAVGVDWSHGMVVMAEEDRERPELMVVDVGVTDGGDGIVLYCVDVGEYIGRSVQVDATTAVPDVRHAGTRGHLLHQVREATGGVGTGVVGVVCRHKGWCLYSCGSEASEWGYHLTEAEALIAALEAP